MVHVTHVVDGHWSIHAHWVGGITVNLQMVYGFFNPLGPVIANARNTMLLGHAPELEPGRHRRARGRSPTCCSGYRIFKRLEVNFADIA